MLYSAVTRAVISILKGKAIVPHNGFCKAAPQVDDVAVWIWWGKGSRSLATWAKF